MDWLLGVLFLIFMLLVDWRLNKIHKELVLLNKGVAYAVSRLPKD